MNHNTDNKIRKDIRKEIKMNFINTEHSYIESEEEKNEGHLDTRHRNFECDNPDRNLGCDLGIDVQG